MYSLLDASSIANSLLSSEAPLDPAKTTSAVREIRAVETRELAELARGLVRPECVLTHVSGLLFVADWAGEGGVTVIARDGSTRRITAWGATETMRPNGIALEEGGTFLLAHLGAETGGVFRMDAAGAVEPVLTHVDGTILPPTNFVIRDPDGGLWITVSTRKVPRADDYRASASSGFVVRVDRGGARIAADGLGYANECMLSQDGRFLYVNETFARRLTRFRVGAGGTLSDRTTLATFGRGEFPDGLALDVEGGIWVVSIVSNRVLRVDPAGRVETIVEDADPQHVAFVETAFETNTMGRPHLDRAAGARLRNISSLAFGGPGLATAYLGCLLGDSIHSFESPVPGIAPIHWNASLGALAEKAEK